MCAEYLGPALRQMNFNYLPFPVNPVLAATAPPGDLLYTEPDLAPGGAGPKPRPPETPPAVSAYTGAGDTPPPPGYGPPVPPAAPAPAQRDLQDCCCHRSWVYQRDRTCSAGAVQAPIPDIAPSDLPSPPEGAPSR